MPNITEKLSTALDGRYQIERRLGEGGMATVYLAEDVKHKRKVAIKVLKPDLAAVLGAERFIQEITTTASLQHPHILPLFDSGEADGFLYYVMPYIEGETLRDKLDRDTQLAIDEAVELTRNIADALDYAHRNGVIHRDIKPENILLHDGRPVVADFGIALAVSAAAGGRMTETGLSLGTPHYMSPEQATAEKDLSARSDVYSLASVLYEMLTGEPPHTGASAQAIIMKIVTEEAQPIAELRKSVPTNVAAAVAQALEKLPADRFGSAADFASALGDMSFRSTSVTEKETTAPATSGVSSTGVRWRPWVIAAIALVAGLAVGRTSVPQGDDHRTYRFTLRTEGFTNSGMDIASDGSFIVYGASDTLGINRLFIRRFDELESRPLPGTEGARSPSLSPDDQQIAYVINRATTSRFGIRRVSVAGTPPVEVSPIEALGVTWGIDDYLYFADPVLGTTARIPAGGGEVEIMVERDDTSAYRTRTHLWHEVLPGGQAVVFTIVYTDESQNEVAVLDLETREIRVLTRGMSPRYVTSGDLLYSSVDGTLFRQPFDVGRRTFTGPAQSVVSGLWVPGFGFANALVSDNGTLVYQPSVATATAFGRTLTGYAPDAAEFGRRISLVDREGIERTLPFPRQSYNNVVVSPDGTRLALEVLEGAADGGDLLVAGIDDTVPTVFTSEGIDTYPVWTPDGTRIAFSRFADGVRDLYWKPADGSGRAEPIFEQEGAEFEIQFTPNQDAIVYRFGNASLGDDLSLRVWKVGGTEHTTFLDQAGSAERAHQLSPDGRWVAYVSDQTGTDQVYVRPFPDDGTGAVHPISIEGGTEPAWNPVGGELFYKERGALIAATVRTSPAFSVTNRGRLFSVADYWNNQNHLRYAVMPDGQSFVMIGVASSSGTGIETVVVTNWLAELTGNGRE